MAYNPSQIEPKWQLYWETNKTFKAIEDNSKPKFYVLDMFPYPSSSGLHVGHPEGYTATDIMARYKRMQGFSVLHPMGYDAFGLPAEQYAIQTGTHPRETTLKNIENIRRQIKSLGFSYDWDREIDTTDPQYFRWTQWIFLQMYHKGLAYLAEVPVNWCPALGTVLANEEVTPEGFSERGNHPVYRRPMKQWMLKITEYAERLLEDLDEVDWPESIKEMQRNWIGKSEGAEVDFQLEGTDEIIRVYTTRPDTLFGATYMVLSPEHPLVDRITTEEHRREVETYADEAAKKSDLVRTDLSKEKTGVFTGAYAINPVNRERIPVWVADYVLMTYGTGAIMAVPSHDHRDFEFARAFNIPVQCILAPDFDSAGKEALSGYSDPSDLSTPQGRQRIFDAVTHGDACWTGDGTLVNSSSDKTGLSIDGLNKAQAIEKTIEWLEEEKLGERSINYKLRDWLFSRQRYWGEPFPLVHYEDGSIEPLDESELPLRLPELDDFHPAGDGQSPLAKANEWVEYTDPKTGRKGQLETNTMPQWAGSCWYYLRFCDPDNDFAPWDKARERYWMPVDLYVGGAEHAVLHLLYARFWHKVLYDLGWVSTKEPFHKLFNQGMILAYAYEDSRGALVPVDEVEEPEEGKFVRKSDGQELKQVVAKMSKSLKNVVNPDEVIQEFGADSMRMYEMFMGPLERTKPWQTTGIEGIHRFLQRVWRLYCDDETDELRKDIVDEAPEDLDRLMHKTIRKVTEDIESMRFNTAISQMMIYLNEASKAGAPCKKHLETLTLLLSPFAPHIAEELWSKLGHCETLACEPWPQWSETLVKDQSITIAVQVNGKVRDQIEIGVDAAEDEVRDLVMGREKIQKYLEGKQIRKFIYVKGRLVSLVVG